MEQGKNHMTLIWVIAFRFSFAHAISSYSWVWKEEGDQAMKTMTHSALWWIATLICMGHLG